MSSTLNEVALDQHFAAQSRVLTQVLAEQISENDQMLAQKWMRHFNRASKNDKYARNCLMLLMFGQLKDMGHLSAPFLDADNLQLSLQEVLTDYDGNTTELQQTPSEDLHAKEGKHLAANAGDYMAESGQASPSRMVHRATVPMSRFPMIKQANQLLMNQVKVGLPLSSRAVPLEREPQQQNIRLLEPHHTYHQIHGHPVNHMIQSQYRSQHHQQQQSQHQQQNYPMEQNQHPQQHSMQHPQQHLQQHPLQHPLQHSMQQHPLQQQQINKPIDQNLIGDVWNFSMQAIDRLDKWRGSKEKQLSFFSVCLRPLIMQEPELRKNIPELDHRLSVVIHQIIDQAAASFNAKENAVLQERANQLLRRQELEQLRADLDRREAELRRHEAARAQNEHQSRSQSPSGDPRQTLYAEERGHPRHLTPTKYPTIAQVPIPVGQCAKCQGQIMQNDQNALVPSGAPEVGAPPVNYICAQCEMESSAVTFNSVDFLQGEQGSEQPEENQMDGESMDESTNVINPQW